MIQKLNQKVTPLKPNPECLEWLEYATEWRLQNMIYKEKCLTYLLVSNDFAQYVYEMLEYKLTEKMF